MSDSKKNLLLTGKKTGKKSLITFIVGGDPDIETTESLILGMAAAGVDLIEIGIPFSDPIAEGPVIEAAAARALAAGTTTTKLFDMVARVRQTMQTTKLPAVPIVFMTYLNSIYAYGKQAFLKDCQACGVDGIIVPDLPFEEKAELKDLCTHNDVKLISLIAPTTSPERLAKIAAESEGFLYCVSSLGVTGMRMHIESDVASMVRLAKENTQTPCVIGFGISTPAQAAAMAKISDGVIVGSALVHLIQQHGTDAQEPLINLIKDFRQAVDDTDDSTLDGEKFAADASAHDGNLKNDSKGVNNHV